MATELSGILIIFQNIELQRNNRLRLPATLQYFLNLRNAHSWLYGRPLSLMMGSFKIRTVTCQYPAHPLHHTAIIIQPFLTGDDSFHYYHQFFSASVFYNTDQTSKKRLNETKSAQSLEKRLLLKKPNTIFLSILSKCASKGCLQADHLLAHSHFLITIFNHHLLDLTIQRLTLVLAPLIQDQLANLLPMSLKNKVATVQ